MRRRSIGPKHPAAGKRRPKPEDGGSTIGQPFVRGFYSSGAIESIGKDRSLAMHLHLSNKLKHSISERSTVVVVVVR